MCVRGEDTCLLSGLTDVSVRLAKEMADEEKDRYLGDWEIAVSEAAR